MMKKIIYILIIMTFLTGCKTTPVNQNSEPEPVPIIDEATHIVFRITWKAYSGRGETISKLVDQYNESQSDYDIELIGGDENLEDIRTQLSDKTVDVLVLPYRYVQILGKEEMLSTIDITTHDKTISEKLIDLGKVESKLYGLPWVSHSMALLYNKTLLSDAGIEPESIVDRLSFEAALMSIESLTSAHGIGLVGAHHNDLSWMVNQFIYGSGGSLLTDNVVSINTDLAYDGIDYYMNILSKYAQPTWQEDTGVEVMGYFRDEKIAFEIQGLWGVTDIWKNGSNFDVGILPLSSIGANAEVGPMMLAYNATTDAHKTTGILDFMNFMISIDAQEFIMNGEYSPEHDRHYPFRLPVREDVIESDLFEPYKIFETFIESYRFPSIDVPSPDWLIIKEELYTPYLNQVVLGEMTIEDFLNKIESEGNDKIRGE